MRRKGTAVSTLEQWLFNSGPAYAERLEAQADPLCRSVTTLMMTAYPDLCYLPNRPDAATFQQRTFTETPKRFHRLMQVVLRFQTLMVIDREYRWGWPIMQRFGVSRPSLREALEKLDPWDVKRVDAEVAPIVGHDGQPEVDLATGDVALVESWLG